MFSLVFFLIARLLEILHSTCGLHLWLTLYFYWTGLVYTPYKLLCEAFAGYFKASMKDVPRYLLSWRRILGMLSSHLQYFPPHRPSKRQVHVRTRNQARLVSIHKNSSTGNGQGPTVRNNKPALSFSGRLQAHCWWPEDHCPPSQTLL